MCLGTHTCGHVCVCACACMNNQRTTFPLKIGLDVIQSHPLRRTHFSQYQAHQLCWSDQEMGTATLCTKYSQMAGLIQENPQKHHLFMQLFFVQLSFVQRLYVVIATINHHILSVLKCVCVCARIQKCRRYRKFFMDKACMWLSFFIRYMH